MFAEDFATFFNASELADSATLGGEAVSVIFDDGNALGGVGFAGMAGAQPVAVVPTSTLTGDPVGLALVVRGVTYTVAAHEPDGTGVSRLILERAS